MIRPCDTLAAVSQPALDGVALAILTVAVEGLAGAPSRLSDYPFVIIRVGCQFCPRSGAYRLARLASKYGPEIGLEALLDALATDCRWHRNPASAGPISRISAGRCHRICRRGCGSLGLSEAEGLTLPEAI